MFHIFVSKLSYCVLEYILPISSLKNSIIFLLVTNEGLFESGHGFIEPLEPPIATYATVNYICVCFSHKITTAAIIG